MNMTSGPLFKLIIVTLTDMTERDVSYLKLKDESGYFGIMKNHTAMLTVLEPCLGLYRDGEGKVFYIAMDGGILIVMDSIATITTGEIFGSEDPEELSRMIDETLLKRRESEASFRSILSNIEDAFIRKTVEMKREFI
jgi:F-type H+-transporting ATPase subunit epsilon